MATLNDKKLGLQCQLCLCSFQTLKVLPCYHVFCENCLMEVVHSSRRRTDTVEDVGCLTEIMQKSNCFSDNDKNTDNSQQYDNYENTDTTHMKCPNCYEVVELPAGGVSQLPTNVALTENMCEKHPSERESLYCRQCQAPVCPKCSEKDHDKHDMRDLEEVLKDVKMQLKTSSKRLNKVRSKLDLQRLQVKENTVALDENIRLLRHHVALRAEELVSSVKAFSVEIVKELEVQMEQFRLPIQEDSFSVEQKVFHVQQLQERVTKALEGASSHTLLSLATDLRTGSGSHQYLLELTSDLPARTNRPVLQCDDKSMPTREAVKNFIGHVKKQQPSPIVTTAKIQEVFRCHEDILMNVQVHAICVETHYGQMFVAYTDQGAEGRGWVTRYDGQKENPQRESQPIKGRVCLSALHLGWVRVEGRLTAYDWISGTFDTAGSKDANRLYDVYNKGEARALIRVHSSGECDLRSVKIKAGRLTTDSKVCDLHVHKPVAMDVSKDGQFIAVVEDGKDHVLIYRRRSIDPVSVYQGSGEATIRPKDVCFCVVGGVEHLIVADWFNDLLHVVDVRGEGVCELVGHLGSECPLLVKPMALFSHFKRLWIACQGGRVLTFDQ